MDGKKISVIAAGSLLYVGINWIPIAGPLIVGLAVGYTRRKGPKDGFKTGVYAGVLGFVITTILLVWTRAFGLTTASRLASLFFIWVFFLWNIVGVFFSGIGGALSSMFFHAHDYLGDRFESPSKSSLKGDNVTSIIICGGCGQGISENAVECPYCKVKIM